MRCEKSLVQTNQTLLVSIPLQGGNWGGTTRSRHIPDIIRWLTLSVLPRNYLWLPNELNFLPLPLPRIVGPGNFCGVFRDLCGEHTVEL